MAPSYHIIITFFPIKNLCLKRLKPTNNTFVLQHSKDVRLPVQLQRAMAAEAEAAREARAKVSFFLASNSVYKVYYTQRGDLLYFMGGPFEEHSTNTLMCHF